MNYRGFPLIFPKNYKGIIQGNEDDYEWDHEKTSSQGRTYNSKVKNPIKQAKRQTYLLASYLKENNIKCWIDYCAFVDSDTIYVQSDHLCTELIELLKKIQGFGRNNTLTEKEIQEIKKLLE